MYAKKVLLPLAFLPIPSMCVVAPSNLVQCVGHHVALPGRSASAGVKFAMDSLLEGGVSCELVSENAKFPASREFTGNFIDSGLGGASEAAKKGMKSVSYGPIPYAS
jgi:hypothetical protein